jgi:hypothetical protein
MSNAGLPEAGDAVFTFPPEVLADPEAYRAAATLPQPSVGAGADVPAGDAPRRGVAQGGAPRQNAAQRDATRRDTPQDLAEDDPVVAAAARARRDLALQGFHELRRGVERDGAAALDGLYERAAGLVAARSEGWRDGWTASVGRAVTDTDAALSALAPGADGAGAAAAAGPADLAAAVGHLGNGRVAARDAEPGPRRYGMCGRLRVWSTRG